ncbi:pseudaminic acid cytidylyltransferase [Aquiluna borgnonia]|uniref:Pseudaminic acid cytidylyltransferase n=1 Tax=Aquiluna borgnonia TaxID=2499157 RepID=A0A7D4PQD0_9MICO|nr:pseudaminic acid cytidylyltransferase [Aquiluna borgnonia]QKJ25046.1 pseudaminic acid cytidylyltransferase [Aquiluna borgnonia]
MDQRYAVIPARGGSKRIPKKNHKDFLGKPMITWPIEALKISGLFTDIFVSTDDKTIANLSRDLGATVLTRDPNLADDFTNTTEVMQHVIAKTFSSASNPWIYKIYPTSPINSVVVREFVKFTESEDFGFSVSVMKAGLPVQRALRMSSSGRLNFREIENALRRTQDLEAMYFDAGKLYGGRRAGWLETTSPLLSSPRGFVLPDWLSFDLDVPEDWEMAEFKCRNHVGK